jgi:hypothetical protein
MDRVAAAGDLLDSSERILLLTAREAQLVDSLAGKKSDAEVAKIWAEVLAVDSQLDRVTANEVRRQVAMREMVPAGLVLRHVLQLIDSNKQAIWSTPELSREQQQDLILRIASGYRTAFGERLIPRDLLSNGSGNGDAE